MSNSEAEPQKERTPLDDTRDEIIMGMGPTPLLHGEGVNQQIDAWNRIPGEVKSLGFEGASFIVDATIAALQRRGYIDESALRQPTLREKAEKIGIANSVIEVWEQMGLIPKSRPEN